MVVRMVLGPERPEEGPKRFDSPDLMARPAWFGSNVARGIFGGVWSLDRRGACGYKARWLAVYAWTTVRRTGERVLRPTEKGVRSMAEPPASEDLRQKPLGELLRGLSEDFSLLLRAEIELARAELTEKGKQAGMGLAMFGAAAVIGVYAFGALTAGIILALAYVVAGWLAAVIVAVAYGLFAAGLVLAGRRSLRRSLPPAPQTVDTLREDVAWITHPRPPTDLH